MNKIKQSKYIMKKLNECGIDKITYEYTHNSVFFNIRKGDYHIHVERYFDHKSLKCFIAIYKNKICQLMGYDKLKMVLKEIKELENK